MQDAVVAPIPLSSNLVETFQQWGQLIEELEPLNVASFDPFPCHLTTPEHSLPTRQELKDYG
jgi:hypothetical protein